MNLPRAVTVSIKPDADGMTGRECPKKACLGYFKIQFGTGLPGKDLPCHCPYCGYLAPHKQFWTAEQLEYMQSVAARTITDAMFEEMKKLEVDRPAQGPFGIGLKNHRDA